MAVAPYVSRLGAPSASINAPQPDSSGLGVAAARFGENIFQLGQQFQEASRQANSARQIADYLPKLDELRVKYENDPDFATAPTRFNDEEKRLREAHFANIDPQTRAHIDQSLARTQISTLDSVRRSAITRQSDTFVSGANDQEIAFLSRAARAGTDAERQAARADYVKLLDGGVASGLITSQWRQTKLAAYDQTIGEARFSRLLASDPQAAKALMDDPQIAARMSPTTVEARRAVAQGQIDQQQSDVFIAQASDREIANLARAARGDAEQKAALRKEFDDYLSGGVAQKHITAQYRQKRLEAYDATLADAKFSELLGKSPAAAKALLDDPDFVARLNPAVVAARRAAAQQAVDQNSVLAVRNATQLDPARGIAMGGLATTREQADAVFGRAIIPQESGGDPYARSHRGALGVGQLMPGTARGMLVAEAKRMRGAGDETGARQFEEFSNLGEGALRELLISDPALNRRLGVAYFHEGLQKYGGNIWAAAGYYHAGPNIDASVKRAIEQFGPNFSAQQLASVTPDSLHDGGPNKQGKKTKDYITDIALRLGVDPAGMGVSPNGAFQSAAAAQAEIASQETERRRIISQLASGAQSVAGEYAKILNDGLMVDPQKLAAVKGPLISAAATGNASAAVALRNIETAERFAPQVAQFRALPPDQQSAMLAGEEARQARALDVTPTDRDRLHVMRSVNTETQRLLADDPKGLLYRVGVPPATLPAGADWREPQARNALALMGRHAEVAQQQFGGDLKIFGKQLGAMWKARVGDMPTDEKIGFLGVLHQELSPAAFEAAVREVAGEGALPQMAGRFAGRDPDTARAILRGAELLGDAGVRQKVEELKPALKAKIGGDLFPGDHQSAVIDAAAAIYAAERGKNFALWDASDQKGMERAIERAAGGEIVSYNGRRMVLPAGMRDGAFRRVMNGLTDSAIRQAGGAPDGRGGSFTTDFLKRNAQLVRTGPDADRYALMLPQGGQLRPVLDYAGSPLTLDLVRLSRDPAIQFAPGSNRGVIPKGRAMPWEGARP